MTMIQLIIGVTVPTSCYIMHKNIGSVFGGCLDSISPKTVRIFVFPFFISTNLFSNFYCFFFVFS